MTTKEINVDELLNSHTEGRTKTNKDSKKNKNDDDWDETEDTNGLGGFAVVQSKSSKAKAKKKVETQGWGAATETKPVAPVAEKIEQPQEPAPKKGIFKKITADTTTAKPKVDLQEELFPTLGEEAPKNVPKKKVEAVSPVKTETQSIGSSGPRRFVNAAKKGAGEHFVPLDPTLTEKALPPVIEKTVPAVEKIEKAEKTEEKKPEEKEKPTEYKDIAPKGFFSRNTKTTTELEANAAAAEASEETKFKFGGEGPKKFSAGNKISFKREEEKSELEDIRLQKEREIEEKLQKEREEAAKARESRDLGRKPREHKDGEKPHHENKEGTQEEKRPAKFANSKKDGEKVPRKISNDKTAPKEPVEEPKIVPAKEVIEIHGSLSTKGWGEDGGIKKKATATTAAKK